MSPPNSFRFRYLLPVIIACALGLPYSADAYGKTMEINNLGPIKKLTIPSSWTSSRQTKQSTSPPKRTYTTIKIEPAENPSDAKIEVYERGRFESEADVKRFSELLSSLPKDSSTQEVSGDQLKLLAGFLGRTGNNQYSNPSMSPGFEPDFRISSASLVRLKSKTALQIDGDFRGADKFSCIYVYEPGSEGRVYEFSLSTKNESVRTKFKPVFDHLVESIDWN